MTTRPTLVLVKDGRYNWVGQPERLIYTGTARYNGDPRTWHQFAKVDAPNECWCEVLTADLTHFEQTIENKGE